MAHRKPVLEREPKLDNSEKHKKQQREHDCSLDNRCAPFTPLPQLGHPSESTCRPFIGVMAVTIVG
jgi:hypothetical protein